MNPLYYIFTAYCEPPYCKPLSEGYVNKEEAIEAALDRIPNKFSKPPAGWDGEPFDYTGYGDFIVVRELTWYEFVIKLGTEYGINISKKDADNILWSWTAFPFAGIDYCEKQIREYLSHWRDGDLKDWCRLQEEEQDKAMRKALGKETTTD